MLDEETSVAVIDWLPLVLSVTVKLQTPMLPHVNV